MDIAVDNVLIYVDDAVREDAISKELTSLGPTYRTVAASTHTPTSFGSLLTGLLPPHNHILSFKHVVPEEIRTVFDVETHETSIAAEGGMNQSIADIFANPGRKTIDELQTPFIHVVRRPGGHAPYNGYEWETYEFQKETGVEYFYRMASQPEVARNDYYEGVNRSFQEFRRVLDVLEDRNLRQNTLVIYTSDHGELLGEYGFFGHTHIATPEVVYVPTTFVHPSLSPHRAENLLHHVDILPTVADAVQPRLDFGRTDGVPEGTGREVGYNHLRHVRYGTLPGVLERLVKMTGGFERTIRSLWDRDGGHVFVDGSQVTATLVFAALLTQKPFGRQLFHTGSLRDAYRRFIPGSQSYGSPGFGKDEARTTIDSILADNGREHVSEVDEETVEHLEEMGYL